MAGFQILNKDNQAITINELDKEAAEFWGREFDKRMFASPKPHGYEEMTEIQKIQSTLANWYDTIGWNIAHQGNYTSGWNNVINSMMSERIGHAVLGDSFAIPEMQHYEIPNSDGTSKNVMHFNDDMEVELYWTLQYYKPYLELIRHWEAKGYTPKKVE